MSKYRTFMKHAEKVTKNHTTKTRPMLQGVKHYEDGSLAVTDSHRLYYAQAMHEKGDCLLSPSGKVIDEKYPDIFRLIPEVDAEVELQFTVAELLKAADIMLTASKISHDPGMEFSKDILSINGPEIQASYQLPHATDVEFSSNPRYWLDALNLFKALKYKDLILRVYDQHRPFTFTSKDEKLLALILPMRRY